MLNGAITLGRRAKKGNAQQGVLLGNPRRGQRKARYSRLSKPLTIGRQNFSACWLGSDGLETVGRANFLVSASRGLNGPAGARRAALHAYGFFKHALYGRESLAVPAKTIGKEAMDNGLVPGTRPTNHVTWHRGILACLAS